jgi:hypothetical protein
VPYFVLYRAVKLPGLRHVTNPLERGGVFGNTDSGGVWLSVRFVRCWVKSHNATIKFETLSKFLMISRRKVRMTSSHHSLNCPGPNPARVSNLLSESLIKVGAVLLM